MKKVAFLTTIYPMSEHFLDEFFISLKNQTYKEFDTVVVNDGFKDFDKISNRYPNLNIKELIYSNTPAKNREFGINYVIDNGYDILVFGDSDDYFSKNRVEKTVELLSHHDIVVNDLSLCNNGEILCSNYISNRVKNNTIIDFKFIKDKNIFGMTNTAIKIEKIEKIVFPKDIIAVDWFFFKHYLKKGAKAIFTNSIISYYRQHKNNILGLNCKDKKFYLWWEKR